MLQRINPSESSLTCTLNRQAQICRRWHANARWRLSIPSSMKVWVLLHYSGTNKEIKCLKYYHWILYMSIETGGNYALEWWIQWHGRYLIHNHFSNFLLRFFSASLIYWIQVHNGSWSSITHQWRKLLLLLKLWYAILFFSVYLYVLYILAVLKGLIRDTEAACSRVIRNLFCCGEKKFKGER